MRILAPSLIAGLVFCLAPARAAEDNLDRRLRAIARSGVDCGRVTADGKNRERVDACVAKCFLSDTTFLARYDQLGDDSVVGHGLALGPRPGGLYVVEYDSMGCHDEQTGPFCGTELDPCFRPKLIPGPRRMTLQCNNTYQF